MSKPISISFGKPKTKPSPSPSTPTVSGAKKPSQKPAFATDPDDDGEDEAPPIHESVLGFASDGGAILSQPERGLGKRVIENKGNADWRRRGRGAKDAATTTHDQQQDQQPGTGGVGAGTTTIEREETSKKAGLQFAGDEGNSLTTVTANGQYSLSTGNHIPPLQPQKPPQTADEAAISALLLLNNDPSSSTTIITALPSSQPSTSQRTATTTAVNDNSPSTSTPT